jgi:hypothetical protein
MASPMRKKRAWSNRDDDAESKETAAFEATVAAAKDTAAKSGAFLSSAKSDLTDHQRWLRAQSAAVERDRQRHERWLQRQQDQREALAKKELARRRRQLMRQQIMLAVRGAIAAVLLSIRSWIVFVFGKVVDGLKFVGQSIARGFGFIVLQIATAARWVGAKLGLAASQAGRGLSAGSSLVAAKAGELSGAAGRSLGAGLSAAGAKGLAGATGRSAASGLSQVTAKASQGLLWGKTRVALFAPAVSTQMARFSRPAPLSEGGAEGVPAIPSEMGTSPAASVHVIEVYGPHKQGAELFGRPANDPWTPELAQERRATETFGPFDEGFWVGDASPNEPHRETAGAWLVGTQAAAQGALSSWLLAGGSLARGAAGHAKSWVETSAQRIRARFETQDWARDFAHKRGYELNQMLIAVGVLLLVCGGLLIGGGLLMRAGARPTTVAELAPEETFSGITWTFNEPDLALPDRAVFTLSGTPESFRINGLSVSGVNNSDQPLTGLVGILKPDAQRPDLKLSLQVDKPQAPAGEGEATAVVLADMVPGHTPFRLIFPFPPEALGGEEGLTMQEFFESYGGLMLKLRYEIDGVEKSVIQYLSPDMLKAQLDEVSAHAGGS